MDDRFHFPAPWNGLVTIVRSDPLLTVGPDLSAHPAKGLENIGTLWGIPPSEKDCQCTLVGQRSTSSIPWNASDLMLWLDLFPSGSVTIPKDVQLALPGTKGDSLGGSRLRDHGNLRIDVDNFERDW